MTEEPDYDRILQANLTHVFGEADPTRRAEAISGLYAEDAVFYEQGTEATGHRAIGEAVEALLSSLPSGFRFRAIGPALGHHGVARLRWAGGPPDGPAIVSGTDVARIDEGKVRTLHVFVDPAPTRD